MSRLGRGYPIKPIIKHGPTPAAAFTRPFADELIQLVTNFCTNGSAETNLSTWLANGSGTVTLTQDATQFFHGTKTGKVVCDGAFSGQGIGFGNYAAGVAASGQTWTVSLWVFQNSGSAQTLTLALSERDSSGNQLQEDLLGNFTVLSGVWTRLSGSVALSNASVNRLRPKVYTLNAVALSFWADAVMLEQGSVAHNYIHTDGATADDMGEQLGLRRSQSAADTLASFADSIVKSLLRNRSLADTLASFSDTATRIVSQAPSFHFAALPPRLAVEINFPKDVARFSAREAVLADLPYFFHELTEQSGTVAADSSGNGRVASYVSAPILAQASPITGQRGLNALVTSILASFSIQLASVSQYVQNTSGPVAPGEFTLSVLVMPTSFPTGANKFDVFKNTGYGRISILSSGQVEVDFGTVFQSGAAHLLTLNQWTRVTITISGQGNNQTHTLYFDGIPVASVVGVSQLAAMSATYRFGAIGSTTLTAFLGQITHLAVFTSALDRMRLVQHVAGHPVDVDPPDIWSDLSQFTRSLSIKRGRSQRLERVDAGTMTLELDNSDRRFEPGYQGLLTITNYLDNPSFETVTDGWSVTNGTLTRSAPQAPASFNKGNWVGLVAVTANGDVTLFGAKADGSRFAVVAGQSYVLDLYYFNRSIGGARTLTWGIEWYDVGGNLLSTSSDTPRTLNPGAGGVSLRPSFTAPANAVTARMKLTLSGGMLAGETVELDALQIADNVASVTAYIDGDTPGSFWEGTPHASRTLRSSVYYPFVLPMRRVRVRGFYPANNMVRDSSFEAEALGTLVTDSSAFFVTGQTPNIVTRQNAAGFAGSWRVKAALPAGAGALYLLQSGSSARIPVSSHASLVFSAYLMRDAASPTLSVGMSVRWFDQWGNFLNEAYRSSAVAGLNDSGTSDSLNPPTSWTRYGGAFTPFPGAAYAEVRIRMVTAASATTLYIDALQVEPGTTVSAYSNSTIYSLFNGYVTAWPQSYPSHRRGTVSLSCVDGFASLSSAHLTTAFARELSGARIGHILDQAGWPPGERSLDAGANLIMANDFTTAAGQNPTNVEALSHAQDVADSELGIFFIEGSGYATFHDGNHRTTQARSTVSQVSFGDGGPASGEYPYLPGILPDYDVERVYNEIRITRQPASSGDVPVEQVANDGVSQARYWRRTLQRTTLLATDAACLAQANTLLARYKEPKLETRQIAVEPARDSRLWPVVMTTTLSDRVTIIRRPQGIAPPLQSDYFIEAVEHQISLGTDSSPSSWRTSYATSLAQ